MKKIISILICLVILFSFSACNSGETASSETELPPYAVSGWEYSYVFPVAEGYIGTTMPRFDSAKGLWVCDRYSLVLDDTWEARQVDMEAGGGWALYSQEHDVSVGVNIFDTAFEDEIFTAENIRMGMENDFGEYIQISTAYDMVIDDYKAVYMRAFVPEELQTWIIVFVNCDDCTYKFTCVLPFDEVDLEQTVTNALMDGLKILSPGE